ncbi:BTAD domain-containing putative transcriptional regulator [Spirillospora sp. NPDC052269]
MITTEGGPVEIRMLGPLEVTADDGARVEPSQPLQRAALCVLAVRAGRPVSARALGELLWGEDAPGRGAGAVKTCLSGVRRALTRDRLPLGHGGYRLVPRPGDIFDLAVFRDLAARAREELARADATDAAAEAERSRGRAADLFGQALDLWREPVLEDLPWTPSLAGVRAGLLGERRRVREEAAETLLTLGRHPDLIPDLRAWLEDDPLNEPFSAALLLALHRSGRKAEALHSYERTRAAIMAATGSEPGKVLRHLAERVRRDDAEEMDGTHAWSVRELPPLRQLPPGLRDFTGHHADRAAAEELLRAAASATVPPIVQVTGPPGIGKTALALHVAHAVEDAFPDGQIHIQLAGASMVPRKAVAVLGEVLRALGVPNGDIPDTLDGRAALYRSRLAGRRVLVFADDAADAAQVRPLLPGEPGSALLVTGRSRHLGLDGARVVDVRPLTPAEAVDLLARIVGPDRVALERPAADAIAAACDGFPLALRIAGARLAARPAWPLSHLAGLLDGPGRLDEMVAGDTAVRTHIGHAYAALDEPTRRAFRMLALAGPHPFAPWVADILLDTADAGEVLSELVDRCLLTACGVDRLGQPRYRMHDLLREFASERLRGDPDTEPALERLIVAWLELVDAADDRAPRDPYFPAPARFRNHTMVGADLVGRLVAPDPVAWINSETPNLRTIVEVACVANRHRLATGIVMRLAAHSHLHRKHVEVEYLWRLVARAATDAGDPETAAYARFRSAAVLAGDQARPADALPMVDEAVEVFERVENHRDLSRVLSLRAFCRQALDRPEEAVRDAERGLELAVRTGERHAELSCLRVLGLALSKLGDHRHAVDAAERALEIGRELGEPAYQGIVLFSLVRIYAEAGRHDRVPALCEEGLALTRSIDHVLGAAYFHEQWGYAHQGMGEHARAVGRLRLAIDLFVSQQAVDAAAACRERLAESLSALPT